jgi:hypothetical protein
MRSVFLSLSANHFRILILIRHDLLDTSHCHSDQSSFERINRRSQDGSSSFRSSWPPSSSSPWSSS